MNVAIRFFTKSKKGNTKKLADTVSEATGIEALDVSNDLGDKVDRLILINAMYAATIDKEVKDFLARNKDKIGEIVNMNTSASGSSTIKAVKKVADELGAASVFGNDVGSFYRASNTTHTVIASPRTQPSGFFRVKVLPARPEEKE